MTRHVSVIVPTFHEAENLPALIDRLERVRQEQFPELELILVDDDSRDGTVECVERLNRSWVRVMVRRGERGLATAVLAGMREAQHETLVVMDADLSHPPEAIVDLVRRFDEGADFVLGSRYVAGATADARWSVWRWLNSKLATLLARPFTRAKDPMSGFFALRRSTLDRASSINPLGYKIGLELIVKCRCRDVHEVPIRFMERTRGQSKLTFAQQWLYVRHIARLGRWRVLNRD